MNTSKKAIVFGSGHLAFRTKNLLEDRGVEVFPISDENSHKKNEGIFTREETVLETLSADNVDFIYIVGDNDDKNIEFLIAANRFSATEKITVSIFNKKIALHLKHLHKELFIISPAEISADFFVRGLDEPVERKVWYELEESEGLLPEFSLSNLFYKIGFLFLLLICISTTFFHFYNGFSLIDSLYFVIVTISTVGYGDVNLLQTDIVSKLTGITLILTSMILVWLSFSLLMNELLKKKDLLTLGIKKYTLTDHVIVCGLGRTGFFVIEKLLAQGHKVLIIEKDSHSPFLQYFKSKGAEFYVGDAVLQKTLQDVNVQKAKALISLINNDSKNLEIGLSGRSLNPNLKLILRIYEKTISEEIKEFFDIQVTFSVSEITAEYLIEKTL